MGINTIKIGTLILFEILQKAASTWRLELLLINDQLILEERVSQTSVLTLLHMVTKELRSFFMGSLRREARNNRKGRTYQ